MSSSETHRSCCWNSAIAARTPLRSSGGPIFFIFHVQLRGGWCHDFFFFNLFVEGSFIRRRFPPPDAPDDNFNSPNFCLCGSSETINHLTSWPKHAVLTAMTWPTVSPGGEMTSILFLLDLLLPACWLVVVVLLLNDETTWWLTVDISSTTRDRNDFISTLSCLHSVLLYCINGFSKRHQAATAMMAGAR
jgi:hypothetical protein